MKIKYTFFAVALWAVTGLAWAGYDYHFDQKVSPYGNPESEAASKLSRGLTNVFYSWMEIFQTPIRIAEEPNDGVVKASLIGVPYGVARFISRVAVGAFEVGTFFVPQEPIMDPITGDMN